MKHSFCEKAFHGAQCKRLISLLKVLHPLSVHLSAFDMLTPITADGDQYGNFTVSYSAGVKQFNG
ncbi:MAG TPA: hypothetical protein VEL69_02030 [Ktedonobacteraceae bacterium]|nr:hypothetical protein [Ktedonobacteraceae bacterium]